MGKLICVICNEEITREHRVLAFAEFQPTEYDWEAFEADGEFYEVIPVGDGWMLAHWSCFFYKEEEEVFQCLKCKKIGPEVSCLSAHIDGMPICDDCRKKELDIK